MRQQTRTPWKKSRTYGDIYGGRRRRRMTDNIFSRCHSIKPPTPYQELPIFIEDNPSREYYFPISQTDLEDVLAKLPEDHIEGLTHIWLRRSTEEENACFANFICGSGVRVIENYPWPVNGWRLLGRKKPSMRAVREYQRFNAELINKNGKWYIYLKGENLKNFYLEAIFLHVIGRHIDWYYRNWSKANCRQCEDYANQYARNIAQEILSG